MKTLDEAQRNGKDSDRHFGRAFLEVAFYLLEVHDVGILVMQIEQVELVGQQTSVEAAFFHDHHVITVGIGVHR